MARVIEAQNVPKNINLTNSVPKGSLSLTVAHSLSIALSLTLSIALSLTLSLSPLGYQIPRLS
jgi:hypothetical protein